MAKGLVVSILRSFRMQTESIATSEHGHDEEGYSYSYDFLEAGQE
jgi:hypothetical protein